VLTKYKLILNIFLFFFLSTQLLSCENFIKGKEYLLPGERQKVLLGNTQFIDSNKNQNLNISPSIKNKRWNSSGGGGVNNSGNLIYTEMYSKDWEAEVGIGSGVQNYLLIDPILIGGYVYTVDSSNNISAIEASSGSILWKKGFYPASEDPKEGFGGGLVAESGIIFFANGFGEIYAIDPFNGSVIWKIDIGLPIRSAPIADTKLVYVLSVDNTIHAFDIISSEKTWEYEWFSETAGFIQTSDMAIYKNFLVVPYRSGEVFVFEAYNGRRLWADTVNRKNITNSLSQIKDILANPILHNEILVTMGFQGRIIANNINNGFRLWELPISGDITPVAVDDFLFVLSQDKILYAININTGEILWSSDISKKYDLDSEDRFISNLLLNNVLHIFTSIGDIIKIDAIDGSLIEVLNNQLEDLSIPPIVVNKKLYVISNNGNLISYR
tara:strand:- start:1107 stop:2429 length:1323 start_codon:yes stop_codon:yes gene_type:complete